ncbi:MAG TPA: SgcJ/EcaC family oxidoreductase [Sphingomicrobium sp.]|nr:SgcJ/EcaC family oxidoreductase [Sphingomicrobium sp.]
MNRVVLMLTAALLILPLTACDRAERPGSDQASIAPDAETDAKKLLADVIAALNAKDWAAVKALYAPDAVMVIPGSPPFNGAQAINGEYDRLAADPAVQFQGTPGPVQVASSGDLAYADATYKMTYTNPETTKVESGNGYCVWIFKKQPDGTWKIVRDVSSPVPTLG